MCAVVRGEGPLAEPHLEFGGQVSGKFLLTFEFGAEPLGWDGIRLVIRPEGHVSMAVHNNLIPIPIGKELWPHRISGSETIMEDKVCLRCVSLHKLTDCPVVVGKEIDVIGFQRLVYGFVS